MAEILPYVYKFGNQVFNEDEGNGNLYPSRYTFMVPPGVSSLLCEVIGAGGGGGNLPGSGAEPGGGGGAYAGRTFSVTPYEEFLFCHGTNRSYGGDPDDGTQSIIIRKNYTETTLLNIPYEPATPLVGGTSLRFAAQSYTTGNNPEVITSIAYYLLSDGNVLYTSSPITEVIIREGSVTGKAVRRSFGNATTIAIPATISGQSAGYVTYYFAPAYLKPNTQYFFVLDTDRQSIPPLSGDLHDGFFIARTSASVYGGGSAWLGTDFTSRSALTEQAYDFVITINGASINSADVVMAVGGGRGVGAVVGAGGLAADCIGDSAFSGGSGGAAQGGGGSRAGSGGGGAAGSSSNGGNGGVGSGASIAGASGSGGTGTYAGGVGGEGGSDATIGIGTPTGQALGGFYPGGGGGGMASFNVENFGLYPDGSYGGVKFTYDGTEYDSKPSMMNIFSPL